MPMSFWDLMSIRTQTVDARKRLAPLLEAGIISKEEYVETCIRLSKTWMVVHDYMKEHEYC